MYSEIKSNEKILINRLDENEKIILEDIYKKSILDNTEITLEKLNDESGDFGGVLIDFITNDNKAIELNEDTPQVVNINVGNSDRILINTNIKDTQQILYCTLDGHTENIVLTHTNEYINIECTAVCDNPINLYYSISAEGYITYNGIIIINTLAKEFQKVEVTVTDGTDNITDLFNAEIIDDQSTEYILAYDSLNKKYYTYLTIGNYTAKIKYKDSEEVLRSSSFTITKETLLSPEDTKIDFEVAAQV